MQGHVIVCGLGEVGYHAVSLLQDLGQEITVITTHARQSWSRMSEERGARILTGDARDEAILDQAEVGSARALLACTSDDTTNIEIALDAQRLNPKCRVVVRIFDLNLANRLQRLFDLETHSTSSVAGSAFASAAFGDEVVSEFMIEGEHFLVLRPALSELTAKTVKEVKDSHGLPVLMAVGEDGEVHMNPSDETVLQAGDSIKVVGLASEMKHLREQPPTVRRMRLLARIFGPLNPLRFLGTVWRDTAAEVRAAYISVSVIILASMVLFGYGLRLSVLDSIYFVLETVTTVGYGDITPRSGPPWVVVLSYVLMITGVIWMVLMYVIVTDYLVSARLDEVSGRRGGPDEGHTIVVGIGDVGLRTAEALYDAGVPVIAVDQNQDAKYFRDATRRIATLLGDARQEGILKRARVETADAIVVTTGDDATNLSVALAAKQINPQIRAVVRILDGEFASRVDAARVLEGAFSAARLTSPMFAASAMFPGVVSSFVIHDHLIVLSTADEASSQSFKLKLRGSDQQVVTVHTLPLKAQTAAASPVSA